MTRKLSDAEKRVRQKYQKEAEKKGVGDKLKGFGKMVYLDVIVRTSGYCLFFGTFLAVLHKGAHLNWVNFLLGLLVLIVMQGVMQHSIDTILDKDPVETSSFRKFAVRTFTPKELKRVFGAAAIMSIIIVAFSIFWVGRWLLIVPFIIGIICIVMYARTSIISYPSFAWANVVMGGYLLQTDFVFSADPVIMLKENIAVVCLCLFVMGFFAIGQVLYKIDDHMRDMTFDQVVAHQRFNLRWMHHQSMLPLIGLLFALFGHYYIAGIFALLFLVIWHRARHSVCNNITCKNNVVRRLEGPCKVCKKKTNLFGKKPCVTCKNFRKEEDEVDGDGLKFLNIG